MSNSTGIFSKYNRCYDDKKFRSLSNDGLGNLLEIPKNSTQKTFKITDQDFIYDINVQLSRAISMILCYNYVFDNFKKNSFKNLKYSSPFKELNDIFSRFMNRAVFSEENVNKLISEVCEKFHIVVNFDLNIYEYYENQDIKMFENDEGIYFQLSLGHHGIFVLSQYPKHIKYLTKFNISEQSLFLYSLVAFNQRVDSHVTFSLKIIQDTINSEKYKGCGFIECYASIWNCQNYLFGKDVVDITYGLIPGLGIYGPFPKDIIKNIKTLQEKYGKVVLLANPVFSEDHIITMFQQFNQILATKKLNIEFVITLPYWDDLYNNKLQLVFSSIKEKGYKFKWHKNKNAGVRSFEFNRNINFSWYHLYIKKEK